MNNEIKEDLDDLLISRSQYKLLLDCITNLQEENERYKNIIDKAIEYIKENSYFEGNQVKTMIYQDYSKYILEILQGEDE